MILTVKYRFLIDSEQVERQLRSNIFLSSFKSRIKLRVILQDFAFSPLFSLLFTIQIVLLRVFVQRPQTFASGHRTLKRLLLSRCSLDLRKVAVERCFSSLIIVQFYRKLCHNSIRFLERAQMSDLLHSLCDTAILSG